MCYCRAAFRIVGTQLGTYILQCVIAGWFLELWAPNWDYIYCNVLLQGGFSYCGDPIRIIYTAICYCRAAFGIVGTQLGTYIRQYVVAGRLLELWDPIGNLYIAMCCCVYLTSQSKLHSSTGPN